MKKILYIFLALLTFYNIYLSSVLIRSGEVYFVNDVARDFLLLQELDQKKIVLIGPRSSTNGLFHGPLWTYINYPAFVLGNGNPVFQAWFWLFLECVFLLTSFLIVRKLFGTFQALVFNILVSIRMALYIYGVVHGYATFFIIPVFLFTIYSYIKTKKFIYLPLHLLALAILVELEIGVGIQFFILSSLLIIFFIYKNRLWKHLAAFTFLPLFLFNFIFFDLRHDFRMANALLSTGKATKFFITLQSWIENRINTILSFQLIDSSINDLFIIGTFILVVALSIFEIKTKNKNKNLYFILFFYYFGYMITSIFNKGLLLFHYIYLLIPLTMLWLISFLSTRYKILFIFIIALVYYYNLQNVNAYLPYYQQRAGNHQDSWKALSAVAQEVIKEQNGKEFGYFVFAPDAFAYQPRYAMLYNFKTANAKAFEYVKKPITYIIASPPPANDIYMDHVWWRKNPVNIKSEPIESKKMKGGFTIEKFYLTPEEQKIPFDKNIELGIHFR